MTFLVDTNLLARSVNPSDPRHGEANAALRLLGAKNHELVVLPQNIYEFCNAASRPLTGNGLSLSVPEIRREVAGIRKLLPLRHPVSPLEYRYFLQMQKQFRVIGKRVRDLRLVASCRSLGIPNILTYNDADFRLAEQAGYLQFLPRRKFY